MAKWLVGGLVAATILMLGLVAWAIWPGKSSRGGPPDGSHATDVRKLSDVQGKRGQRVSVTAPIFGSATNNHDALFVDLRLNGATSVECRFAHQPGTPLPDWFLTLETGRKVTVVGTVSDFEPNQLRLEACTLTR